VVLERADKSPEQEFTEDILSILQVFACRWNGKRRYAVKNEKNKNEIELNAEKNI
jgi:predicted site-specific integrase-resolvase